jgi:transposase
VTQVAQRHEIRRQQIYAWWHDLKKKGLWSPDAGGLFYPIDIPVTTAVPALQLPALEVPPLSAVALHLPGGRNLHFDCSMDPAALTALIRGFCRKIFWVVCILSRSWDSFCKELQAGNPS